MFEIFRSHGTKSSLPGAGRWRRIPWVTCLLMVAAGLAEIFPGIASRFEDLSEVCIGGTSLEFWRPITAHLAHLNFPHLLLNVAFFVPLAWLRECRRGSLEFGREFIFLAVAVAVAVRLIHPDWVTYGGFSGVIYGLLVLTVLEEDLRLKRKNTSGDEAIQGGIRPSLISILIVACLIIKTVVEILHGGWFFFSESLSYTLTEEYLPGSHLGGIVGGLGLLLLHYQFRRTSRPG